MLTKQRVLVSSLVTALCAATTSLVPMAAHAQLVLEEVVVTARKREESLQDTPIAVSALTGDNLDELGLRNISDLTKVVPNVDMYSGNGTTGAANVFIRGVGARNTGVNFDSGVGIYVDGVYLSRPDGAVLDNIDVQSVQVLRGPQGTLFGKNTTGGAILYTTNKPHEEFAGNVQVRIGNYNRLDAKATVNVPLVGDTLMSRFSVYSTTRDGYVQSVSNGDPNIIDDEYSDEDRKGAQAQLRWVAADDLTFDLNYSYGKTDQASRGQNCEVVTGIPGSGWQSGLQDDTIIIPGTGKSIAQWCAQSEALGIDKIQHVLEANRYLAEVQSLSLTADWDLNDNVNFKSITAYRDTEGSETNELDAIGISNLGRTNFGEFGEPRHTEAFSQEFQFAGSAFDDRLEYVVGVFGFTEKTDKGTAVSPSGPFFNTLGGLLPSPTGLMFYINQTEELLAENTSASAFSQVDWQFDDYWSMTLGLRYTWEERELERKFRIPDLATLSTTGDASVSAFSDTIYSLPSGPGSFNPNHGYTIADDPDNPGSPDPLADQKLNTDGSDWTPMVSIQRSFDAYGFMDSGTLYLTAANGFLSGGITDTVDINTRMIEEFDPEEVWNYEVGFKMDAWDRKLRFNTALFYTDYKDRQLTTIRINPDTGRIAGALINAESSRIAGIEFETTILPIENLMITANMTFNDGDISKYEDEEITAPEEGSEPAPGCDRITVGFNDVDNCPIDRSDENLPRLPDEVYFLAVQYNWDTSMGTVVPMISWSYRTGLDNCFDHASCLSGVYLVDQEDVSAQITWTSPEDSWRVTAYGNNLTDDRYVTGGTPLVGVTQTAGTVYNLPRTYGIEAAYTW
ncbi:MAG: iron complex outermembrane receptor protein [Halioglobus sp.]|jgi:iron complex outermembrane receptor protein